MKESPNKRAIVVGLFVFLGLIFLLAGVLIIGNLHETFSRKINIVTVFNDVNGLQNGNNIWFSGVKIGTVKKLEFIGKSQVKVIMKIDKKAKQYIRKDAKVKVGTEGLIGNKILIIYGGTFSAGEIEEGDAIRIEPGLSTEEMLGNLAESNKNVLAITSDFKVISKKLAEGGGTLGMLLKDEKVYKNIETTTASLKNASEKAEQLINSLSNFSSKLNQKGTFSNDLVTDTVIFNSFKSSVLQLHRAVDTASIFIADLKNASKDIKSPVGVLLHDQKAGSDLKITLQNLESGSGKLDQDLEALQHNFLFRKYFRKKAKEDTKTKK
jgi:phospholipid/cholesterol/gamma-HCH transport system substrate-binding protein